jgi:hypothetical protein
MARKRLIPKKRFTKQEIEEMKAKIETLSFEEMKDLWRYAPIGHPYFRRDLPLAELFKTRLIHLRDTQGGKNA